ncbi:UNVERIFIED_CONTAM: hypothetical protein FKN15_030198 [Acipenser sinensis]
MSYLFATLTSTPINTGIARISDIMYHVLIFATIVEMQAMMTFEHNDIINAGSTMKGTQAVCQRLTMQPPKTYSVGGQRSSGQLTDKPAANNGAHETSRQAAVLVKRCSKGSRCKCLCSKNILHGM